MDRHTRTKRVVILAGELAVAVALLVVATGCVAPAAADELAASPDDGQSGGFVFCAPTADALVDPRPPVVVDAATSRAVTGTIIRVQGRVAPGSALRRLRICGPLSAGFVDGATGAYVSGLVPCEIVVEAPGKGCNRAFDAGVRAPDATGAYTILLDTERVVGGGEATPRSVFVFNRRDVPAAHLLPPAGPSDAGADLRADRPKSENTPQPLEAAVLPSTRRRGMPRTPAKPTRPTAKRSAPPARRTTRRDGAAGAKTAPSRPAARTGTKTAAVSTTTAVRRRGGPERASRPVTRQNRRPAVRRPVAADPIRSGSSLEEALLAMVAPETGAAGVELRTVVPVEAPAAAVQVAAPATDVAATPSDAGCEQPAADPLPDAPAAAAPVSSEASAGNARAPISLPTPMVGAAGTRWSRVACCEGGHVLRAASFAGETCPECGLSVTRGWSCVDQAAVVDHGTDGADEVDFFASQHTWQPPAPRRAEAAVAGDRSAGAPEAGARRATRGRVAVALACIASLALWLVLGCGGGETDDLSPVGGGGAETEPAVGSPCDPAADETAPLCPQDPGACRCPRWMKCAVDLESAGHACAYAECYSADECLRLHGRPMACVDGGCEPIEPLVGSRCDPTADAAAPICPENEGACRCPPWLTCTVDWSTSGWVCAFAECYTPAECEVIYGAPLPCVNGLCLTEGTWVGEGDVCDAEHPCADYLECSVPDGAEATGECVRRDCYDWTDCPIGPDSTGAPVQYTCNNSECIPPGCEGPGA